MGLFGNDQEIIDLIETQISKNMDRYLNTFKFLATQEIKLIEVASNRLDFLEKFADIEKSIQLIAEQLNTMNEVINFQNEQIQKKDAIIARKTKQLAELRKKNGI